MNYLGDALMTTPAHAALRRAFPDAQIDSIAGAQSGYGAFGILASNPDIDHLIPRVSGGFLRRCWQLWITLVRGKYETVVILPSIFAYKAVAFLAFTPRKIFGRRTASNEHMCDAMLDTILPLIGGVQVPRKLVLHVDAGDQEHVGELLAPLIRARPLIGVNLGASRPQKRWPAMSFVTMINQQIQAGRSIVLLGGANSADRDAASTIMERVGSTEVLDLTGKTNIGQLAAVIETCDVVVTADTGAMHIAAAVSTPVAALFGSTNPTTVGPYGDSSSRVIYKALSCSPCNNHPSCNGQYMCMSRITPQEVSIAIQELLDC